MISLRLLRHSRYFLYVCWETNTCSILLGFRSQYNWQYGPGTSEGGGPRQKKRDRRRELQPVAA